jgi:ribosome-binding factor A
MKIPRSKRARRISVAIQKVVANFLQREVSNRFPGVIVTVPEVRTSDDLKVAEAYCSIIGAEDNRVIHKFILKNAARIRMEAASALHIKSIPEFRFVWDDTIERADRIEQLFKDLDNSSSPPPYDEEDEGGTS